MTFKILEEANERTKADNKENVKIMNLKRKTINLEIGDFVWEKVNRNLKVDPFWEGPLQIKSTSECKQCLTLQDKNKMIKTNIKNVRPAISEGGEDVVISKSKHDVLNINFPSIKSLNTNINFYPNNDEQKNN